MAPEQVGGVAEQGPPTDVWGLGTLYRALTGRPPFTGDTTAELLFRLMRDEPPAPRSLSRSIHIDLETILVRCLAKEGGGPLT